MTRTRTRVAAFVVALVAALAFTVVPGTHANAGPDDVNDYLARINRLRASVGAQPLTLDSNLSSLAQGWAQSMANAGTISHTPDLAGGVTSTWAKLGENVGMGPNTEMIFNGFVNSAPHYANLVDPAFTHIGIGVVWSGNRQFTTHRFMAVRSAPAPAPTPIPAPAPSPRPAPSYTQPAPVSPRTTAPANPAPAPQEPETGAVDSTPPASQPVAPPVQPARVIAVLDALHSLNS